jgi:hypothetical protein
MRLGSNSRFFKILRDERGILYEIPVLIVFLIFVLAVGVPIFKKHGVPGLLHLALWVILIGGFFVGFAWFYLKVVESSTGLKWWVQYLTGVMVDLLFGGFVIGIFDGFLYPMFPGLQLNPLVSIEAGVLLIFSLWHSYYQLKKKSKAFPPAV